MKGNKQQTVTILEFVLYVPQSSKILAFYYLYLE